MKSLAEIAAENGVSKNVVRAAMLQLIAEDEEGGTPRFGLVARERGSAGLPLIKLSAAQEEKILLRLAPLVAKRKIVPAAQLAAFSTEFLLLFDDFTDGIVMAAKKYGLTELVDKLGRKS
jgi:hypothetical protein